METKLVRKLVAAYSCLLLVASLAGAAEEAKPPAKVAGQWEMTWEGRMGTMTATLTFEQDGDKLKGTITGPQGRETPVTGSIKGNSIRFSVKRETPRGEMTLEYTGTVNADSMKGTVGRGQFSRDWTAKRKKAPAN